MFVQGKTEETVYKKPQPCHVNTDHIVMVTAFTPSEGEDKSYAVELTNGKMVHFAGFQARALERVLSGID